MGMVIHDDYWEAAQAMPEKQRAAFIYAIAEYRFTGKEPKGSPQWLPTFLVIKKRIEMGDEASEKGRNMARARWDKERAKQDAEACSEADAQAYAAAENYPNTEVEVEIEVGEPPYSPPVQAQGANTTFGLMCLNELNEVMGTCYGTLPSKSAMCLSRMEGKYEPDEVRRMIEFKRDEWAGTRFAKNLTPNTLFGPDHFEQYMHQSRTSAAEKSEYEQYD